MAEMIIANSYDRELWYADNAEPKSISEIRKLGVNIHPCDGKTDLINYAVKILNNKPFYVTKRSVNIINELHGELSQGTIHGETRTIFRPANLRADSALASLPEIRFKFGHRDYAALATAALPALRRTCSPT